MMLENPDHRDNEVLRERLRTKEARIRELEAEVGELRSLVSEARGDFSVAMPLVAGEVGSTAQNSWHARAALSTKEPS